MIEQYVRHNLFRESTEKFLREDPQLALLKGLAYVHPMDWWKNIDWRTPGIYLLTGGRQIGKTTSTKLLIKHALTKKLFAPQRIFYLPCDQIDDYHHLSRVLGFFFDGLEKEKGPFLLIIDEITFVREWDRSIKALADEGRFREGFCIVTGSDSVILKEASKRFPGRRGHADTVDFHLLPLTFREYIALVAPPLLRTPSAHVDALFQHFDKYLICGGYLRAINDLASSGVVAASTYAVFEQWIAGDFEKRGKRIDYLRGVLGTLIASGVSQATYSSLTQQLGLLSKETFIDYCSLLERMDLIFTLQAFDQNTRRGFPKKARKFHFTDPFIIDTVTQWLIREGIMSEKDLAPVKAEAILAEHVRRIAPTYYLKAEGEIDAVAVVGKKFAPLEVTWTNQLRSADVKQLLKYPYSRILTKQPTSGAIQEIPATPLPLFLALCTTAASLFSL